MEKLDLRKQYKYLYSPSAKKVEVVDVPPMERNTPCLSLIHI